MEMYQRHHDPAVFVIPDMMGALRSRVPRPGPTKSRAGIVAMRYHGGPSHPDVHRDSAHHSKCHGAIAENSLPRALLK